MSVTHHLLLPVSCVSLIACSGETSSVDESANAQPLGYASVTLNGKTERLDIWLRPCGEVPGGESFVVLAGIFDPDDPDKRTYKLNLGGSRKSGGGFGLEYATSNDGTEIERVSDYGGDVPWMQGNRFFWSGKTRNGDDISVELESPA